MDNKLTSPIWLSAPQRKISHSVATMPSIPRPIGHPCGDEASLLDACRCGDEFALRRAMVRRHSTTAVNLQDETGKVSFCITLCDVMSSNARADSGYKFESLTALSHVCASGSIAVLELLLLVPNLNVNLTDREGNSPLHFAAQAGKSISHIPV
uniref:Uncharacterized protein n=1 Tax=Strigamia maritima TaxID=126957 RepID=T1JN03_STRMM